MRISGFGDWIDVEIMLRDAALDPHVRPSRRAIANLCLGVPLEDAYYSVRELREAVQWTHEGHRRGRSRLVDILGNLCDDFQRAVYYALAGRGIILVLEDLTWLEELLLERGRAAAAVRSNGQRIMPLVAPYMSDRADGPVVERNVEFALGPSWWLDPESAV